VTGHEWDKLSGQTITVDYMGHRFEDVKVMAGRDNFPHGFCDSRDTGFAWLTGLSSKYRNIHSLDIRLATVA
jgi:hypothetical protein